jgi:hypothetical protein
MQFIGTPHGYGSEECSKGCKKPKIAAEVSLTDLRETGELAALACYCNLRGLHPIPAVGQIRVHTRIQTSLLISLHGMRRQSDHNLMYSTEFFLGAGTAMRNVFPRSRKPSVTAGGVAARCSKDGPRHRPELASMAKSSRKTMPSRNAGGGAEVADLPHGGRAAEFSAGGDE